MGWRGYEVERVWVGEEHEWAAEKLPRHNYHVHNMVDIIVMESWHSTYQKSDNRTPSLALAYNYFTSGFVCSSASLRALACLRRRIFCAVINPANNVVPNKNKDMLLWR